MSKRAIKKILSDLAFDPKATGPLKVISEAGNREYYVRRACEELMRRPSSTADKEIDFAIQLLVLAKHGQQEANKSQKRTRSNHSGGDNSVPKGT